MVQNDREGVVTDDSRTNVFHTVYYLTQKERAWRGVTDGSTVVGTVDAYLVARLTGGVFGYYVHHDQMGGALVQCAGTGAHDELLKDVGAHAVFENGAKLPGKVDAVLETVGKATWEHSIRSLKPGGRVAVIDYRLDSPEGPPKEARIAPERVKAEMKKAGYVLVAEHSFLPRQYFLVFRGASM